MRKFFTLATLFIVAVLLGWGILSSLRNFIRVSDFKKFAENKIGDVLKARIRVHQVKVGFLDQISLLGLQINQHVTNKVFYLLDIDKVVFKYNVGRFWRRDFQNPNTVFLDSPQFLFQSLTNPLGFIHFDEIVREGARLTDELVLREGKISFDLPGYHLRFDLHRIRGKLKKIEDEKWQLALEGRVDKLLQGTLALAGTVNFSSKESSIQIFLNHLNSTQETKLPLKDLFGIVLLSNDEIHFKDLSFRYNRLPIKLEGWIRRYATSSPELSLKVHIGEGELRTIFQMQGGLNDSVLVGEMEFAKRHLPLHGKVSINPQGFLLDDLRVGDFLGNQGEFNFSEKTFHLYLERAQQRIDLGLNVQSGDVDFWFQVDHMPFFGADLVTRARLQLRPDGTLGEEKPLDFQGILRTDYLILDQTPFPDFRGEFHLASSHLDRMKFQWGKGYELTGSLGLKPPFSLETQVDLREINLHEIESVFSNPLPENFKGIADGAMKIRGEGWKVEVEGNMSVSNGSIGRFDYDEVSLHFYGIPPYLKIKDSWLKKGLRTFYLEGGIDLSKDNVFQDIRVSSTEKILVWSGKELARDTVLRKDLS